MLHVELNFQLLDMHAGYEICMLHAIFFLNYLFPLSFYITPIDILHSVPYGLLYHGETRYFGFYDNHCSRCFVFLVISWSFMRTSEEKAESKTPAADPFTNTAHKGRSHTQRFSYLSVTGSPEPYNG